MNFIKYYKHYSYREHHYYKLKIYTALSCFFKLIYMENHYPFLFNVWFAYEGFESSIRGDASENSYSAFCDVILNNLGESPDRYKSGCMKLMRNLKYYAPFTDHFRPTKERCDILYNWINNSIQDDTLKENIINKCFDEYDTAKKSMNDNIKCSYKSNNEDFENPMNIILLNIFNNNTQVITDTLTGKNVSDKLSCQKFVCEAVKIYKDMYETYCHNKKQETEKLQKTCLKLSQFKDSYDFFHKGLRSLNYILPSLDDIDNEISAKCSSDQKRTLLALGGGKIPGYNLESEMTTSVEGADISLRGDLSASADVGAYPSDEDVLAPFGNGDNPMKKTITTTVGTVAGASSLLALLYRVNAKFHKNIHKILHRYS
ncbi:hypothetical protein PVMG_04557 [Plasmodium vivax Mauritania I]|uniref:Uncharacterized protein n=1 Tax=Plasmodium vivax Mauritania I TaxID=1035515 RepID=A0A0J9T516_PLAVI|nr:hypothetical protein PVMG_04557 [Plasmodium vivax Mauritania I]